MSIIYHSNVTAYVTDCLCRYKAQHLYKSVCLLNLLHRFYYLGFVFPSHYNFVISRHGQAWSGCGSLDKQEDKAGQQHKYWSPVISWSWAGYFYTWSCPSHHTCWGAIRPPPTPPPPNPATVCNYLRLLGLTPWFSLTRKGEWSIVSVPGCITVAGDHPANIIDDNIRI